MTNDPREQRELEFSDAFLTELSRGVDRSEGTDELAGMLLELRGEVDRPLPSAPRLEAQVVELSSRRRSRPFFAGLVGAAAATLVIAGSGAMLLNAGPNSPLYGLSTTLFPRQDPVHDVVELAGTLEEMDSLAERGDMDGVRLLIEQARLMAKDMEAAAKVAQNRAPAEAATPVDGNSGGAKNATVTVTTTVPGAAAQPAPRPEGQQPSPPSDKPAATEPQATVTETNTVTVTTTVVATPEPIRGGAPAGAAVGGEQYVEPTAAMPPAQETPLLVGASQDEGHGPAEPSATE
ncbi:hypothetical protein H7347_05210 [Corynebacterium sp. zg-331]|uniref:hypothetical protein n=1 Tax=unclassified Corynebacterium TaxID=2624378 RepID=UPI00128BB860|nr:MULTISPECIES: hypothetical protein [unclassified Corynebacterium]MBC3185976.1 hypothetical protein [Corynebacterium sp. zg-331]MPV52467.1 hypothetical protein [Corynebacterium sp. zg331]